LASRFHAIGAGTLSSSKDRQLRGYPEVITRLPEADTKFEGVRAWMLQGEKHQLVFFEMEAFARAPDHRHDYDQWGFMVQGKMELTINGKKRVVETGDEYLVPAQAQHSAIFLVKSRVIDFFSEKNRYKPKSP
jgi:quercetin dioxygenase-like cupin family protein